MDIAELADGFSLDLYWRKSECECLYLFPADVGDAKTRLDWKDVSFKFFASNQIIQIVMQNSSFAAEPSNSLY